jgi:hemolysin activation/secretion protein
MGPHLILVKRYWQKSVLLLAVGCMATLIPSLTAAQERFGVRPDWREFYEQPPPYLKEEPRPVLPVPEKPLPGPPEMPPGLRPIESVFIREIKITGSTVLGEKELAALAAPYTNRQVSSEELERLRRTLTLEYINRGYINSGALIPDQTVADGVVTVQIIEGRLTDIQVEGNRWFWPWYYRSRIALDDGPPLNLYKLQRRLQFFQLDDRIQQIHAELKPGLHPGEGELKVRVDEPLPFKLYLGFDNYQSPNVGAEEGWVTFMDRSLTGHGDILNFTYTRSDGIDPQFDISYSLPFTPYDTTLTFRYRKNESVVVEEPFDELDINSRADIYQIGLRQPIYRTLNQELALSLTGEHSISKTFLLDEPFSFSPGTVDGEAEITALRFGQEWLYRTPNQVFAARSRLSFGLDALGATIHQDPLPDSDFFAWLGQFQWARQWDFLGIQTIFKTDVQLATDPLLPLEQIPVGGRFSVRGYTESQLVTDNAFTTSLEARIPIVRDKPWADYLQLAPFVDFGMGWNNHYATPSDNMLVGIGIGLRWGMTLLQRPVPIRPQLEIYWGYPLMDVPDTEGKGLQGQGVYLQFVLATF